MGRLNESCKIISTEIYANSAESVLCCFALLSVNNMFTWFPLRSKYAFSQTSLLYNSLLMIFTWCMVVQGFEGVQTCRKTETLGAIMERIVKAEVHRLVIVDDNERVSGVVSLSDILQYLVLRPIQELRCELTTSLSPVWLSNGSGTGWLNVCSFCRYV